LISVYSSKKGYFTAVFKNITGEKRVEKDLENAKIAARNVFEDLQVEKETLAHEKAKDEAMLASIGDGVIIADMAGKITFMNQSAQNLLGWKSDEVVEKLLFDIVPIENEKAEQISPEARPTAIALATGTTTTTTVADATYYYVRKNKTKFPAAIMATPVILDGKVIGTIEVFRDVTEEREIDRAKTEFVSLASHQLRTPLSSVRWYSDMLLDGDAGAVNDKQKQYLEEIRHGNLRMIELVNTLLHVSKLELGTAQVHIESVQVAKVVAEVLRDLDSRKGRKAVSVEVKIPDSLAPMMTDAKLIRIVIENLISNAIKYAVAQGMVKISAREISADQSFEGRTANQKSLGLSVSDNGIGIPEAEQGQVFKKLFRAENAREIDTDGTGLGLYLTRLVLERMKGQIWFRSGAGKGTAFHVLLPYILRE